MNKEAVQHERGPRNSTIRKQMADFISARQISPDVLNYNNVSHQKPSSVFPPHFSPMIPFSRLSILPRSPPRIPQGSPPRIPLKLEKPEPRTPSPVPQSPPIKMSTSPLKIANKLQICETAAKILLMNSRLLKCIPAFKLLSVHDQELLYTGAWIKLLTLGCAQYLSPQDLDCIKNDDGVSISSNEMSSFIATVKMIQSLNLTEEEYGHVRNVIFFRQSAIILDKMESRQELIQQIGDHAHLTLAQSIMIKSGSNSLQFAKSMMALTNIEPVSSKFFHELFFKETIGNISLDVIVIDMLRN